MSAIHIVERYPYPVADVWRVLTDPELVARWTTTGQGGRPVGFAPIVGTRFRFVAKPMFGWRGIVDCEVLEARAPTTLRYSWRGDEDGEVTEVAYCLEPEGAGTLFTYDHTGFTGLGGAVVSRVLARVRRKMLEAGVPAVLSQLRATTASRHV